MMMVRANHSVYHLSDPVLSACCPLTHSTCTALPLPYCYYGLYVTEEEPEDRLVLHLSLPLISGVRLDVSLTSEDLLSDWTSESLLMVSVLVSNQGNPLLSAPLTGLLQWFIIFYPCPTLSSLNLFSDFLKFFYILTDFTSRCRQLIDILWPWGLATI